MIPVYSVWLAPHGKLWYDNKWYRLAWIAWPQALAAVVMLWFWAMPSNSKNAQWAMPMDTAARASQLAGLRDTAKTSRPAMDTLERNALGGEALAQFFFATLFDPGLGKKTEAAAPALFSSLDDDALLSIGVPADWLADLRAANEDGFFALAVHLPAEASEALLEFAATGKLAVPAPAVADPFKHPDALRRIRPIADQEELEQALAFPWEQWGVFLHPSQRVLVERSFSGPARVAGSAGTGKTIVAIHRAVRLARENPGAKILQASFSQPLADAMAKKTVVLAPETSGIVRRITTASFRGIAVLRLAQMAVAGGASDWPPRGCGVCIRQECSLSDRCSRLCNASGGRKSSQFFDQAQPGSSRSGLSPRSE